MFLKLDKENVSYIYLEVSCELYDLAYSVKYLSLFRHCLLASEVWINFQGSPFGICGGKVPLGQCFLQVFCPPLFKYRSTYVPYSYIAALNVCGRTDQPACLNNRGFQLGSLMILHSSDLSV
jgi:hypothetical protein